MKTSAVEAIVRKHLGPLVKAMGLEVWKITVRCMPVDDSGPGPAHGYIWRGSCSRESDYDRAIITLDPEQFATKDAVIDTLVHELIHVALAPFDLYRKFACSMVRAGSPQDRQESHVWNHATEQAVLHYERALMGAAAHGARMQRKKKGAS